MRFVPGPEVPLPEGARCSSHPATPATAACRRCGLHLCGADAAPIDGLPFCKECAARPDVDGLLALRTKCLGERDGWAWLFGAFAVADVFALVKLVSLLRYPTTKPRDVVVLVLLLGWAVVCAAFWAGARVARRLALALWLLQLPLGAFVFGSDALPAFAASGLPLVAALTSTRTRLFFRLEVSRTALRRLWRHRYDNPIARQGFTMALLGPFMPPFAPLAVVLGVMGLQRVDSKARPPMGRRGQAIAAIAVGALFTVGWGVVLAKQLG